MPTGTTGVLYLASQSFADFEWTNPENMLLAPDAASATVVQPFGPTFALFTVNLLEAYPDLPAGAVIASASVTVTYSSTSTGSSVLRISIPNPNGEFVFTTVGTSTETQVDTMNPIYWTAGDIRSGNTELTVACFASTEDPIDTTFMIDAVGIEFTFTYSLTNPRRTRVRRRKALGQSGRNIFRQRRKKS